MQVSVRAGARTAPRGLTSRIEVGRMQRCYPLPPMRARCRTVLALGVGSMTMSRSCVVRGSAWNELVSEPTTCGECRPR